MNAFHLCAWRWGFWFRVFGYGLHIKRAKGHVPLFSERYGYRKAFYALGLRFEALKPKAGNPYDHLDAIKKGMQKSFPGGKQ